MTKETINFNDNNEIRYISVGLPDLIKGLLTERPFQEAPECNAFVRFSELLQALYHSRYFEYYRDLKHFYQVFNPDQDVLSVAGLSKDDSDDYQEQLFYGLKRLLKKANYDELNQQSINQLLQQQSTENISVDVEMDDFDEALFYVRGQSVKKAKKRDWRTLFLTSATTEVLACSRLFVAMKLQSEEKICENLKEKGLNRLSIWNHLLQCRAVTQGFDSHGYVLLSLFRDVPVSDLEMLFPNKKIKISFIDEEVLDELDEDSPFSKFAAIKPSMIFRSLTGFVGIITQQLRNLLQLKSNYQRVLSRGLSSHQLDINVGVISSLVDQAREEEIKEALLAYYFLMRAGKQGMTQGILDQKIETHLMVRYGVFVDFKVREPVQKLKTDGLVKETEDGLLQAVSLEEASSAIVSQREDIFSVAKRLSLLGKI